MTTAAYIDLGSLSDRHLQSLVCAYYAAAGEGATSEDGADLDVCQAVARELKRRRFCVDLPWGHGKVDADQWLKDVQNKIAGGF